PARACSIAALARARRAFRKLRASRSARQIETLAGTDPMGVVHAAPIGGIDALVAPAGTVMLLGDTPERVTLLDDIPAGQINLGSGCLAGSRRDLCLIPATAPCIGGNPCPLAPPCGS